jgi:hypothetical protein
MERERKGKGKEKHFNSEISSQKTAIIAQWEV